MTTSEQIYQAAARYLGVAEVPGPKSNKLIQGWIRQAADWLDTDDSQTPWCGCFRGHLGIETATGTPREHFRARSWLNWGRELPLDRPELWHRGDTVVLSRTGGAHVALLDRVDCSRVFLLGGNQGDRVCIAPFPRSSIIGVRAA